jgi:hypothetical protein
MISVVNPRLLDGPLHIMRFASMQEQRTQVMCGLGRNDSHIGKLEDCLSTYIISLVLSDVVVLSIHFSSVPSSIHPSSSSWKKKSMEEEEEGGRIATAAVPQCPKVAGTH